MTEFTLSASPREVTGKGAMRKLRRSGLVPAVVYGLESPLSIQLDAHDTAQVVQLLHGGERLISLQVEGPDGNKKKSVLLKEIQTTPVGGRLLHIDFYEVNITEKVQVSVEVRPEGKGPGEAMGGILQQVTHEITIECLPTVIPEFIPVDVTALEIGDTLHLSDIQLSGDIVAITPLEETLFVMAAPRVEEEPEPEEELEEGLEGAALEAEGEEGEDKASDAEKTEES